jgi:nitrilase
MDTNIKVSIAQISPVWLNKIKTIKKVENYISEAGDQKSDLIVFGESLIPGYPFWLGLTNGAEFNSNIQKEIHSHYIKNSIQIEAGDLNTICKLAKDKQIAVYLGLIERAKNRGGHSLYCSLVYIDKAGKIQSVHRKLQPTYDERLVWSHGDGNGLRTHTLEAFTVGGLNCWENWMPLPRTALYAMGENLHVAVWPGSIRNTEDITRFIAKESRSYVISASALMRKQDFPKDIPYYNEIIQNAPEFLTDGGSCIAAPDGTWVIEPHVGREILLNAEIDINRVYEERQNFDPSGHYSRPDVTQLIINRERQSILKLKDDEE